MYALRYFRQNGKQLKTPGDWQKIESLARNEPDKPTKAMAMDVLSLKPGHEHLSFFKQATRDSSYSVAGAALEALMQKDIEAASLLKGELEKDAEGRLLQALTVLEFASQPVELADSLIAAYKKNARDGKVLCNQGHGALCKKTGKPNCF